MFMLTLVQKDSKKYQYELAGPLKRIKLWTLNGKRAGDGVKKVNSAKIYIAFCGLWKW